MENFSLLSFRPLFSKSSNLVKIVIDSGGIVCLWMDMLNDIELFLTSDNLVFISDYQSIHRRVRSRSPAVSGPFAQNYLVGSNSNIFSSSSSQTSLSQTPPGGGSPASGNGNGGRKESREKFSMFKHRTLKGIFQ